MNHCYARFEDNELCIGNDVIERRWRCTGDSLVATSMRDLTSNTEWIEPSTVEGTCPAGVNPIIGDPGFRVTDSRLTPVGRECLSATLTLPVAHGQVSYTFNIVPGQAMVHQRLSAPAVLTPVPEENTTGEPTGIEVDQVDSAVVDGGRDLMEAFTLAPHHSIVRRFDMADQTDHHDNLFHMLEYRPSEVEPLSFKGCVFAMEDVLSGEGLIFIKHAPLPHVRPEKTPCDCRVHGRFVRLHGHGCGDPGEGYPWTVLIYSNGLAGMTRALQSMQVCHRLYREGRDGQLLSNTWGDRSRDGALNEAFLLREIELGAELGIDVCQIDDGWQQGVTANSVHAAEKNGVWEGFYASDPDYWSVHQERFPNGMTPLTTATKEKAMGLGLWYAPDSHDEFVNVEKDIEEVVRLYREEGVRWIKIDGVKARTRLGERQLEAFFNDVLTATDGGITFDLDITAEIRPGYWGRCEVGTLFVENRYTDLRRYWPHTTFRNLWQLTRVIHPARLRMEWLNPERNTELYEGDPLAPVTWNPAYTFATLMVASPLIWCELSGLSEPVKNEIRPLIATWKDYRPELHTAIVHPIGDAPNGAAWSGYLCQGESQTHALLFREENRQDSFTFVLPEVPKGTALSLIAGGGLCQLDGHQLKVTLPDARSFLWVRFE